VLPLRRRADIHSVLHQGHRFYLPWGVAHARRRDQEDLPSSPRVAVFTARGFANAVSRNRARRLVRETCRVAVRQLSGPWDVIFVLRPQVLTTTYPARLQTVTDVLQQLVLHSEGLPGCSPKGAPPLRAAAVAAPREKAAAHT
jgi:ribonuclease P protein component